MGGTSHAWREGFHEAWIAAVAFPLVVLLPAFVIGGMFTDREAIMSSLPWVLILGSWGFVAGLLAVSAAALLRLRRVGGPDENDLWRWSRPAVLTVVMLFAAFVVLTAP